MPLPSHVAVVLHQIRSPDNLGAVARVMANFGTARLVLSDPVTHAFTAAQKLAVGAEHVLERMDVAVNLRSALAEVTYACGTTSRTVKGRTVLSPEQAVARLREKSAGGPVALVLGGEKRGLSDEDLSLCQDVLCIPTDAAQPSMNVAQAAAVLLYLWSRAEIPDASPRESAAPLKALHALEARAGSALSAAGFSNPQAPEHILRELMRTLERAGMTRREVELWLAAFDKLSRAR